MCVHVDLCRRALRGCGVKQGLEIKSHCREISRMYCTCICTLLTYACTCTFTSKLGNTRIFVWSSRFARFKQHCATTQNYLQKRCVLYTESAHGNVMTLSSCRMPCVQHAQVLFECTEALKH